MDQACGAPPEMAEKRDELTPMMAQYHDLCARYDDAIVLFQVGDFYETFCGAAERTARLLELTLTSREDSTGEYPMTGVPVDNAASYIEALLEAGYRVAIADQVEEPDESPGVVERAVTRVITPGTITEDELLAGADNNFVAALSRSGDVLGLAFLDVSTGDFLATSAESADAIADELSRFDPAEVITGPDASGELVPDHCMVTTFDATAFDLERARAHLSTYYGSPDSLLADDAEIRACGAALAYAEYARGGTHEGTRGELHEGATAVPSRVPDEPTLEYLTHLTRYDPREYLLLDAVALRSLELFEPRAVHGRADATLIGVLDETASALGGRTLRDWLRRPLLVPDRIAARHDAVEELTGAVRTRERCHDLLGAVYDVERLIGRISRERANARDLRALRDTLAVVPDLRDELADVDAPLLEDLRDRLDPLEDVRTLIEEAIVADPPIEITEGGIIAEGYDDGLDELRSTAREGKRWIDELEASERERTGISSLKVGSNAVHGYYIEVTNPNLESVPDDYQRRQTLKNAERFVTPALKEREDEIVGAERRAEDREYERFCAVRREVAAEVERVQVLANAVATLDVLVSLATVAAQYDYCRPDVLNPAETGDNPCIRIEGGRHPVVERTQESFVPNGANLDADRRLAIITGPNMSGKSTYMRQIAQIVLLAQVGSFVPARAATLTPLERIFTRVGASDDIAGGRSTFMVEMDELATILEEADERSLVVLDEVGRGTSTADGLAIARATVEHLHDEVGALTLFATHHHPVTTLANELEATFALHFETSQDGGEVVFHHEIAPGAADGSYGVEVATAAGVPSPVVERARELVESPVPGAADERATPDGVAVDEQAPATRAPTPSRSDGGDDLPDLAVELRSIDVARLTPVEALTELDRLKRLLED